MGRIRTIKPEFPQSESMGRCSRDARLCFMLLWGIADDAGRLRGNPRMISSLIFPYDDDAPALIEGWLQELENQNSIVRYVVDGNSYLQICNWNDHQKIDRPSASKFPNPPGVDTRKTPNPDSKGIETKGNSTKIRDNSTKAREESTNTRRRTKDQGPRTKEGIKEQGKDQGKIQTGRKLQESQTEEQPKTSPDVGAEALAGSGSDGLNLIKSEPKNWESGSIAGVQTQGDPPGEIPPEPPPGRPSALEIANARIAEIRRRENLNQFGNVLRMGGVA